MGNSQSSSAKSASASSKASASGSTTAETGRGNRRGEHSIAHPRDSSYDLTPSTTGGSALTNIDSAGSTSSESNPHYALSKTSSLSPQQTRLHPAPSSAATSVSSPAAKAKNDGKMGNSQSAEPGRDKEARKRNREQQDAQSEPVQVPTGGQQQQQQQRRNRGPMTAVESSGPPHQNDDYVPKSNLNFPPRLPLPIQEEVYTPGSPIISPEDLSSALHEEETNGVLPQRTSLLSHTTIDEDEEALEHEPDAAASRTVPTLVQWRGRAEKVYITGTFAAWSRKFRMHRDPNDPELLSAKLDLPPGTHHVKFIVDGEMKLSNDLPTAVDYTNILVNYIEVSADDIPPDTPKEERPEHLHPPLVLPPSVGVEENDFAPQTGKGKDVKYIPTVPAHHSDVIPVYLSDLDRDEQSNRFRRSAQHVSDVPVPPTLPLFLSKSILNGTTPMKDDSSVLLMPNHTVLNHLATSSIKNEVLATSLTTRYKRKYVTTITYRPTKEDD